MFHKLTTLNTEIAITTPGKHVFFFENLSGTLTITIAHSNARVYVYGIYDAYGAEHYTLTTHQHHSVPNAQSYILINGVFRTATHFNYTGTIYVDADATDTTATLINRNLNLGTHTAITTVPTMEVIPSSVHCTHAATVATIDPAHYTYLATRGITRRKAQNIIANGFLNDIRQQCTRHIHNKATSTPNTVTMKSA